jgi:signal transduction histidine kinase/CheY-like chemotaxis protein
MSPAFRFHRRIETHVVVAVTLIVVFALGAALLIARRVVTDGSLERASSDLAAARSAFYRLEDDRAQFASAQAALVTTQPVFRAYLTDSQLINDRATMQVLADQYRQQLKAAFCIVTGRDGTWSGSSGWPGPPEATPPIARTMAAAGTGRSGREIAAVADRLFLVVSEPARFAEETLGTLTVGYALDDDVARGLAQITHGDVNIVVGHVLAASSLAGDRRMALASLVAGSRPLTSITGDSAGRTLRIGSGEYVAGAFPLAPGDSTGAGQLLLLEDWTPVQRYLNQLGRQMLAAGSAIFALALLGGLVFARRVSQPLTDMASAAGDIASGNWSRQMPVRGSAEATDMAHAFNQMTTSLRHWYEEARKRDDQLRQAQKMEAIGRLAGGVAHDFNNLLTAIHGYGELVMVGFDKQDPRRADVEEILTAAERAGELTRQLLTFSRREVVMPRILALDRVVENLQSMLRRVIGEDIQVVSSIDPDVGLVRADRTQMEQVLINLVVNARDAMPAGGTVRIGLANAPPGAVPAAFAQANPTDRYVCLSVADAGHGMDEQTVTRIFEPFFTTKETGRGTGLGLSIVYGIVQQAGGTIDVKSTPGEGTTFLLYLPQATDAVTADQPDDGSRGSSAPLRGSETVLVAEDDGRLGTLIGNTLRQAGYTVLLALDGEAALAIAGDHSGHIDLLLTDVVMPGMNGRVLSERLTAARPDLRVLFMSGYSDDAVLQHGIETATAPFIQKPFSMDALLAKMREMLNPWEASEGSQHPADVRR